MSLPTRMTLAIAAAITAMVFGAGPATAAWTGAGTGPIAAKAQSMPAGNQPSGSVLYDDITVTWSASAFAGGANVSGYDVKRYSTGGVAQTVGAGCSGTIAATTCTEQDVPVGNWRYAVVPRQGAWSGAESSQSSAVAVSAPALSLTPTTIGALPASLTGSLAGFAPGQTVTFRLDNATTGTVLTGSITPSPVPASGNASVTVTLPTSVTNGPHTVFAVGSAGTIASQAITVARPAFVRAVGSATCGTGATAAISVPAAGVAAGDTVVIRVQLRGANVTGAVSATDSRGNSYSIDLDRLNVDQRLVILSGRITTALASGNTITVTRPLAESRGVTAAEFSNIADSGRVDASASAVGTGLTPSASVTTSTAGDLLVGAVSAAGSQTPVQPSGWTALTTSNASCGGTNGAGSNVGAHRLLSGTGTFTYNPTISLTGRWVAGVVAYKPSS